MIRMRSLLPAASTIATVALLTGVGSAPAVAAPIKLVPKSRFGRQVNVTATAAKAGPALEDACVESKEACQAGEKSSVPGGFEYAEGVAGTATGDIYVADGGNHRIQELTASGQFVLMFGKDVDETTGGDICTAASKDVCKAGVASGAPGEVGSPYSVAVDPTSSDVYVGEVVPAGTGASGERVQEFTPGGQFVLEIGKEVNAKTKGNLCTHAEEEKEGVVCKAPAEATSHTVEAGSFHFERELGNLLAVGHEGQLYVGEEGRVQEFNSGGEFSGEIPLTTEAGSGVVALAADQSGDLFLTFGRDVSTSNVVREFDAQGKETKSFTVAPPEPGAEVGIFALAVDAGGHLAVVAQQQVGSTITLFGSLYETSDDRFLTAFAAPGKEVKGIGFDGAGELFSATGTERYILAYKPEPVAEMTTLPTTCVEGAATETDVTLNCQLNGEVNPENVTETEVWFEWARGGCVGLTATPKQPIETVNVALIVSAPVQALRPNETYCDLIAGEDANVKSPERLDGEREQFTTPLVAPRLLGEPQAQFVGPSSAVMFGELNPENANTDYYFEYAPGKTTLAQCAGILDQCLAGPLQPACSGVAKTQLGDASVYGRMGGTLEASGLQPGTEYSYRLYAESENDAKTEHCAASSPEQTFTTAAAPEPSALTAGYSALTATSAIVSGTVTPDGVQVTYAFELGVYDGASTQYGVVASGLAGPSGGPVEETLALTGLQPGTTYAYRISVSSGYIDSETHTLTGQTGQFTTNGLPTVLAPPVELSQLPTPKIAFPKSAPTGQKKKKAKHKTKHKPAKKVKKARRKR